MRYLTIRILSLNLLLMKTMFIIVLTALMVGVTGVEKTKAADREGVPLKITVIEKCQYVESEIWISTIKDAYEVYKFTSEPVSNYAVFTRDYIPGSGIYMSFTAPYVSGIPSWFKVKVYQDTPSNVLVDTTIPGAGTVWGDYVVPKPTQFEGEQVNLFIEVTILW